MHEILPAGPSPTNLSPEPENENNFSRKSAVILSAWRRISLGALRAERFGSVLLACSTLCAKPPKAGKSRPQEWRPRDPPPVAQDDISLRSGWKTRAQNHSCCTIKTRCRRNYFRFGARIGTTSAALRLRQDRACDRARHGEQVGLHRRELTLQAGCWHG